MAQFHFKPSHVRHKIGHAAEHNYKHIISSGVRQTQQWPSECMRGKSENQGHDSFVVQLYWPKPRRCCPCRSVNDVSRYAHLGWIFPLDSLHTDWSIINTSVLKWAHCFITDVFSWLIQFNSWLLVSLSLIINPRVDYTP